MITVHHLGVSQSERIVWLFEELGLPYALQRYARDPATGLAPAAYKALHPMGTAPIITDGDLVLAETGAIVEYVIAKRAGGRLAVGVGQPNYADYLYWFHFANGSLMPAEMMRMVAPRFGIKEGDPAAGWISARSDRAMQMIEERLGQVPYFAGAEFTAADIMMVFALTTARAFAPRDYSAFPHIRAYLQRIGARPAYRRAMAKGDPEMAPLLD